MIKLDHTLAAVLTTCALALCSACDLETGDDLRIEDEDSSFRDFSPPPIGYNSGYFHMFHLRTDGGLTFDGQILDSVTVMTPGGPVELDSVHSADGVLYGEGPNGALFSGADFVGSVWEILVLDVSTGVLVSDDLVITAFQEELEGTGLSGYEFEHIDWLQPDGSMTPVCFRTASSNNVIIPVSGFTLHWDGEVLEDPSAMMLACAAGSTAKALEWGYNPEVVGAAKYQTTVRMVRADYCGDGEFYTAMGEVVVIEDLWGINSSGVLPDPSLLEAGWTPSGASCLNTPRRDLYAREDIPCAASLPYCSSAAPFRGPHEMVTWNPS